MHNSAPHHALLGSKAAAKSKWRGYVELTRLHKSVLGNTLMFWPCGTPARITVGAAADFCSSAWGLTMAGYAVGTPIHDLIIQTIAFGIGSTLLHSAACVLNDICDIDFDGKVGEPLRSFSHLSPLTAANRTDTVTTATLRRRLRLRGVGPPHPPPDPHSGNAPPHEPHRVRTAPFPAARASADPAHSALYGLIGIFPLHALYPLMKRWTYWPQAWLGPCSSAASVMFAADTLLPRRTRNELGLPHRMDGRHAAHPRRGRLALLPRHRLVRRAPLPHTPAR